MTAKQTKLALVKAPKSKPAKRKHTAAKGKPVVDYGQAGASRQTPTQCTTMNLAITFVSAALGEQPDCFSSDSLSWCEHAVVVQQINEDTCRVEVDFGRSDCDGIHARLYAVIGWAVSCRHEVEVDGMTHAELAEATAINKAAEQKRGGPAFLLTDLVDAVSYISATLGEQTSGGMADSINWHAYAAPDAEGNTCDPVWLEKAGDTYKLKVYFWAAKSDGDTCRKLFQIVGWAHQHCFEIEIE